MKKKKYENKLSVWRIFFYFFSSLYWTNSLLTLCTGDADIGYCSIWCSCLFLRLSILIFCLMTILIFFLQGKSALTHTSCSKRKMHFRTKRPSMNFNGVLLFIFGWIVNTSTINRFHNVPLSHVGWTIKWGKQKQL